MGKVCGCSGKRHYWRLTMQKHQLNPQSIKAIESVLSKGDRAEVVPVKDGVKVLRVRREEVKNGN